MAKSHSYINTALEILSGYDGSKPFTFFIKAFFSSNKKYGSRDRKMIADTCYCWFRTAWLFEKELSIENLKSALFLCNEKSAVMLQDLSPELYKRLSDPAEQKIHFIGKKTEQLFPFAGQLGDHIPGRALAVSYLQQPKLFLRSRPGKERLVKDKLKEAGLSFEEKSAECLALSNGTKLEDILKMNRDAVVQDMNSQKVFEILPPGLLPAGSPDVWDCCAASGGKSILFFDKVTKNARLTVSDIRKSILHNCMERLQQAFIPVQQRFVADLAVKSTLPGVTGFDIIICDAPCTGSGTWGRTPEQLTFFDQKKIDEFASLQKSIAANVLNYLRSGGLFFYITCSVFKKENEGVVEALQNENGLALISFNYLEGYQDKADTMFVSLFRKR